ncbi:MAG TPA: serine hydrolase domain-containing protein [Gemmatimonadales bacterium]
MRALAPAFLLVAATALTTAAVAPQDSTVAAADTTAPPRTIAELQARIREILAETKTPGIGIAIVSRDSVLWAAGIGTADVASGRAATDTTLFRIGSTSKAFVSLLVLLEEQAGRLTLQDPVWAHAPELVFDNKWEDTDPIRLVHVLEHATGWDDLALRDYAMNDSTISLRDGLAYNPKTRTSRWRPGTRVSYCNSGPPVAAYIVEKLEGRPFEDLVRERLFEPIGMTTATYFRPDPPERLATLYENDGETPQYYWHILQRPAGAINASARDMAAYVRFLLNRGAVGDARLLPAEVIEAMERPRSSLTARSGLSLGYGLHLSTYVDTGWVWVGHDGGVNGGLTNMAYRPDQGVGFAFMINAGNVKAYERIGRVVRDFLTQDQPRLEPPPVAPVSQLARDRAGWYRPDNPRIATVRFLERILGLVRVTATDSGLTMKPLLGEVRPYVPVSDRLFRRPTDPVATLALVDDPDNGRAEAMEVMGYLMPASLHRAWTPLVWLELGVAGLFVLALASTALFALVWIPRLLFGKLAGAPKRHVRVWPLLAALTLVAWVAVVALNMENAIPVLGNPTAWAWTLTVTSLLFPLFALIGLLTAKGAVEGNRLVRWQALFASSVFVVVSLYLLWFGIVGWRSWA